jgi:hypothetical protein
MTVAARAWSERVTPRVTFTAPQSLRLREPDGNDELSLDGIDTRAAATLLARLVEPAGAVAALAAPDRDALLAVLHRGLWGDRIETSLACGSCGSIYDLSFTLTALQRSIEAGRQPSDVIDLRTVRDGDGQPFMLPDADAEDAAAQLGEGAQTALTVAIAGNDNDDPAGLDARLEAVAPLLDVDLDAPCAECGHPALARFDIQTFTLQRLLDEREATLVEVHSLASGYGWTLGEILGLTRGLRRAFAQRLGVSR